MPQDPLLRPYWVVRERLSLHDQLLIYADRIVMPSSLRLDTLQRLHEGHLGITKCRARACEAVWWPLISQANSDMISQCQICARIRPPRTETLLPSSFPSRPWERLGMDLFTHNGRDYLLVVDYFSRWLEVRVLENQSSAETINRLKSILATHGIPEVVVSDNCPQFSSALFAEFAKSYDL